jgi:glycogen operon protein
MTLNELIARHRVEWHGVVLGEPDWSDASHSLAATFHFDSDRLALHLMINAYWEALTFAIPPLDEKYLPWRRCVDTFRLAPEDIRGWLDAETVRSGMFVVQPRSIVVLVTKSNSVGTKS